MVLAVIAILNTALAFFYYLRVMMVFYGAGKTTLHDTRPAQGMVAIVLIASALIIGLGIFPEWLLEFINSLYSAMPASHTMHPQS